MTVSMRRVSTRSQASVDASVPDVAPGAPGAVGGRIGVDPVGSWSGDRFSGCLGFEKNLKRVARLFRLRLEWLDGTSDTISGRGSECESSRLDARSRPRHRLRAAMQRVPLAGNCVRTVPHFSSAARISCSAAAGICDVESIPRLLARRACASRKASRISLLDFPGPLFSGP